MITWKKDVSVHLKYPDIGFRLMIGIPVTIFIVLFGESKTIFEAVFYRNFWLSTIYTYLVTLLVFWMIKNLSSKLDTYYQWRRQPFRRLLWQLPFGVGIPAMLTYGFATAYFMAFHVSILETSFLRYNYPLIVLLIFLANLYYLVYYLWVSPVNNVKEAIPPVWMEGNRPKELFMAKTAQQIRAVLQEDIAALCIQERTVLLKKFDRETFPIEQSLSQAMDELDPHMFFRINKTHIVNYRLCQAYSKQGGKLSISLGYPINSAEVVSRRKAHEYEQWLKR